MSNVIALFLGNLHGGGAQKYGLRLAEGFVKEGFEVDLVIAQLEGPFLNQLPPGVRVVHLDTHRFFKKIIRLRKYLRENSPRVLISLLTRENVIALIANQFTRQKTPVFVSERSVFSQVFKTLTLKHKLLIKPVLRYLYPRAEGVIAISGGVAEDLSRSVPIPRERIHVIYNPLSLSEIELQSKQAPVHPWCSLKDKPLVLAVGRLAQPKDFHTLIEAFDILNRRKPSRLLILGEGEDRAKLEKKVRDLNLASDIDLPGFVENPYSYMSQANVLVLSSRFEGLANVLIEALACGTPVVSTDCPCGPAEVLGNGKFGSLVPIKEPAKMAQAILDVLERPQDKEVLRKRAQFFSHEGVMKKYVDLIKDHARPIIQSDTHPDPR